MRTPRLGFLLLGILLTPALWAGSLESALQARAMLGPETWSRVLRIENPGAGPGSRYPAEFHALVVEFQGVLWLYTEWDGTQTLSLYAGRLAADKTGLGPLLRAIEPGWERFEDVTDRLAAAPPPGLPPNHCFLASVRHWEQLRAGPEPPQEGRLLAYYPKDRRMGHMVLEYRRDGRRFVFDPDRPERDRELPGRLGEDPLQVAQALVRTGGPAKPARAMQLALARPAPRDGA